MRLELTKRADYAIRSVLALARSGEDARLSTREIAEAHGVPERFLGQVMRDLVAAGLVEGTVGRTGGYRLAKPSSAISLLEIVEAVEGDSRRRTCILRNGPCAVEAGCAVHAVFAAAQDDVLRRLGSTTVAAAARGRRV